MIGHRTPGGGNWQLASASSDPFDDSLNRIDLVLNPCSYTAWDGSSSNWYYADEEAWGTLYLAP